MDLWPREWRECHLQFSKWVFESSKAKVWVIHGRVNREIYQEWYQADLVPFETKCKHEISVSGAIHIGGASSVLRVIIWAMHPEALFKTAKTEQFRGLRADQAWNLAGSLVGIDMDETYFQRVRDGKSKACTTLDLVVFQQHQESLQLVEP